MANYRAKYGNYHSDTSGLHAPVGSILPVFADGYQLTNDPDYAYRGHLYCNGQSLRIRDYPELYSVLRNQYGGSGSQTITQPAQAGGMRRTFWIGSGVFAKMFINFYRDGSINANVKRPYPYGAVFRFTTDAGSLGSFDQSENLFAVNTFYTLLEPSVDVSAFQVANEHTYEIGFPDGTDLTAITQALYTLNFTTTETHPTAIVQKSYNLRDTPYQIGTFNLPDYRNRKIVGFGEVNGAGTSTVENAINNFVGQTGGQWFISKDTLVSSQSFFVVGDIKTTGYTSTIADVPAYVTGEVTYTVGPMEDYVFPFPPQHTHRILSAEADETKIAELGAGEVDKYASNYITSRANVIAFEPDGEAGSALGHSHGLLGVPLQSAQTATYGNVSGIGEDDGNYNYYVSEGATIAVLSMTYDGALNRIIIDTDGNHGFGVDDVITINGALPIEYSGNFTVLAEGLASQTIYVEPRPGEIPGSSPATGTISVKLANGYFVTAEIDVPPRAYVVDSDTKVGGKQEVFEIPGNAITLKEEVINQPGSKTVTLPDASQGEVIGIEVIMTAPGGGGADSDTDGQDGGYASFSIDVDGTLYTIYCYGGQGGQAGNSGGAGGTGGTLSVPAVLTADSRFSINVIEGDDGQNGITGSSSATALGGGPTTEGSNRGGNGYSQQKQETVNVDVGTFTTDGEYDIPPPGQSELSRAIGIIMSGGGGGAGNPNANSGCSGSFPGWPTNDGSGTSQKSGAVGGYGGNGKRLIGTLSQTGGTLSWEIGKGGNDGFNNKDGNSGTGTEAGATTGADGAGSTRGGNGGLGYWGNGATAGSGGGVTGLFLGGNAIAGAGGGGGGGGSGGGYNGGGTTDGCYAGGNAREEDVDLITTNGALDFADGANGNYTGCTAGGGGGGGAGCGIINQAEGGEAGLAGVGHNGNGGGTGGRRGASAVRSNQWVGDVSADNLGSPPSTDGYVSITFSQTNEYYDLTGGGGGQGASIAVEIQDIVAPVYVTLQGPGQGGGIGESGGPGQVYVRYAGQEEGTTIPGQTTVPTGNYYECDTDGTPQGAKLQGNVWQSSSDANMREISFGAGTGSIGGFAGSSIPFNTTQKITRYIPFTGLSTDTGGERLLEIGPFNLATVNTLRLTVIRGSGQNGGEDPEEALNLFYRKGASANSTLFSEVLLATNVVPGWQTIDLTLPEGDGIRDSNVTLILSQDRPINSNDNSTGNNDNYGLAAVTLFYDGFTQNTFVSTGGASIPGNLDDAGLPINNDVGIDQVRRTVTAVDASLQVTDGLFTMSSSTPIVTTAAVVPEKDIPLITKYHKVKYLIKAY